MFKRILPFAALSQVLFLAPIAAQAQGEVNVYTYREAKLIAPLFDAFTRATGVKVNVVSANAGLEQRIVSEGANSPADLLLTVDVARIQDALDAGIAAPFKSDVLEKAVPADYRDSEGQWYGVSVRARVIYASRERVPQTSITYEELAEPKWKGKVCIRSGQNMYNNALFAAVLARHGEAKTEQWLRGLKANLAQRPSGGDREVARDIAAGRCDIGLGNTYYWALMSQREADRKPWADATRVILPVFAGGGTHVNVSAVMLVRSAPNRANAVKLSEWLVGEEAQRIYADMNFEYPVRAGTAINPTVASYGSLTPDPLPLTRIMQARKQASQLVDKVGFDN